MSTKSPWPTTPASPRHTAQPPRPQEPRARSRRSARPNWLARVLLAFCVVVALAALTVTVGMLRQPRITPRAGAAVVAVSTATSTPSDTPNVAAGVVCHIPPAQPAMLTPDQIEHPAQTGTHMLNTDHVASCVRFGLPIPDPTAGNPNLPGQVILVSLTQQWLWAYQDGTLVFATPVTTGMPYLWTPQGTFPISMKATNQMFYSPWPPGSPFYYTPEHVNYEMLFRQKGFYIHDAPWRHDFGPGTDVPHSDSDGTQETGSHGCIEVVTPAAAWLYNWAAIGATVSIVA